MHVALPIALGMIALATLYKSMRLARGSRWVWRFGADFRERIHELPESVRDQPDVLAREMFDQFGWQAIAWVYPDQNWRRAVLHLQPARARSLVNALYGIRTLLRLQVLLPVSSLVLIWAGHVADGQSTTAVARLSYGVAVLVLLLCIVSAVNTFLRNAIFGPQGPFFLGLPKRLTHSTGAAQNLMATFMGCAVLYAISAAAAIDSTSRTQGGFAALAGQTNNPVAGYINTLYEVLLVGVGLTDLGADSPASKTILGLTIVLVIALVLFLVGGLLSGLDDDGPSADPSCEISAPVVHSGAPYTAPQRGRAPPAAWLALGAALALLIARSFRRPRP
jgi:hypothetical protein